MNIKNKPAVDISGQATELRRGYNLIQSDIRPVECQTKKNNITRIDKKSGRKIAYYENDIPIYEGTWKANFLKGDFQKHGVRPTACGLEPMAEDDTTEEYRQQQAKCWIFEGISEDHVRAMLARIRAELEEDRAAHRRKIISTRCKKDDLPALKKMLRPYLLRKGIKIYDNKKPPLIHCLTHEDNHPSAVLYEKQEIPVVWCPICGSSKNIFDVAGLLIGSSDFKMQIQEVKGVMNI